MYFADSEITCPVISSGVLGGPTEMILVVIVRLLPKLLVIVVVRSQFLFVFVEDRFVTVGHFIVFLVKIRIVEL